jgi:hypothetical protein
MADSNEKPPRDGPPPGARVPDDPEARSGNTQDNRNGADADFIAELKKNLEQTRLSPEDREQILAEMPSWEEQERLYRELIEQGGLSGEEFLASLELDGEPQP